VSRVGYSDFIHGGHSGGHRTCFSKLLSLSVICMPANKTPATSERRQQLLHTLVYFELSRIQIMLFKAQGFDQFVLSIHINWDFCWKMQWKIVGSYSMTPNISWYQILYNHISIYVMVGYVFSFFPCMKCDATYIVLLVTGDLLITRAVKYNHSKHVRKNRERLQSPRCQTTPNRLLFKPPVPRTHYLFKYTWLIWCVDVFHVYIWP